MMRLPLLILFYNNLQIVIFFHFWWCSWHKV
jgi:hypothetical protein